MKKILSIFGGLVLLFVLVTTVSAAKSTSICNTIQDGSIVAADGSTPITVGYDQWGYNYQAHMFNGWYENYTRPTPPVTSGDWLMMKWNDAWISNKDCGTQFGREGDFSYPFIPDNKLDRHFPLPSYFNSGAWLTNHASGSYIVADWQVNATPNYIDIPWAGTHYLYNVTFSQSGSVLTGTLNDPYYPPDNPTYPNYPATGPINGIIDGDDVTFTFDYPLDSPQGLRTYIGVIDAAGNLNGNWTEDGSEGASGTFSVSGFATEVKNVCEWKDFVKIIAVPSTATNVGGTWFLDGTEIGQVIWGQFALIQEISSDPCGQGVDLGNYKNKLRLGLGNW